MFALNPVWRLGTDTAKTLSHVHQHLHQQLNCQRGQGRMRVLVKGTRSNETWIHIEAAAAGCPVKFSIAFGHLAEQHEEGGTCSQIVHQPVHMLATSTTRHVTNLRKHQPSSVQYLSETIRRIIRLFNKTYDRRQY
jgi:hypothetical protein